MDLTVLKKKIKFVRNITARLYLLDRLAKRRRKTDAVKLRRIRPKFQRKSGSLFLNEYFDIGVFTCPADGPKIVMSLPDLITGPGDCEDTGIKLGRDKDFLKRCRSGMAALICADRHADNELSLIHISEPTRRS